MRRAQVAVGAAVQFDEAVEDRGARQALAQRVFDVDVQLAIGHAAAHEKAGVPRQGRGGQAMQGVTGRVQPLVQGREFLLDRGVGRVHVDAQLGGLREAARLAPGDIKKGGKNARSVGGGRRLGPRQP